MEKKMTYAVAIDKALEVVTDQEVIDRLNDLKVAIAKRSENRSKKMDEKQTAYMAEVLNALEVANREVTVTEIVALGVMSAEMSAQRTTAMLKKLVAEGKVKKTIDKKRSLYSLA
jgi:predicted transcriptional regulator